MLRRRARPEMGRRDHSEVVRLHRESQYQKEWPENPMVEDKPKRRWQDLLHKKCPNCSTRLEDSRLYFVCPNPHPTDPNRSYFFIKKTTAAEYLLNPDHPANFCLSEHERATVEQAIQTMGIVV